MNHLEQLVSEWLQYSGYFVRTAMMVGPRSRGGFEGELDVVGLQVANKHLLHVECSLDALSWAVREERFRKKFDQGQRHIKHAIFQDFTLPETIDGVVVLQFAGRNSPEHIGGGRLVTGKQFVREILDGLKNTDPASGAVPSTFPLLRTLQLAAAAQDTPSDPKRRLIPAEGTLP
jgi:hypothetical protein